MNYNINYSSLTGVVPMPSQIFDYLKECGSDYLKVLFFILGSRDKPSIETIADSLLMDLNTVKDAIRYWDFKGILLTDNGKNKKKSVSKPNASDITTDELVVAKNEDQDASRLFDQAEYLYNRPLKPTERRNLLYILDTTSLSIDVILMAIDYCVRIDKPSSRYILAVCENWDDNGITSHEKAEEHIKFLLEKDDVQRLICSCFGIHNRKLSSNESKSIEKWVSQYNFSIDMIKQAYDRCIDNTGKLSFPYISKILSRWHKSGISTVQKIEEFEKKYKIDKSKSNKNDDDSPSYDIEELAKKGLFIKE